LWTQVLGVPVIFILFLFNWSQLSVPALCLYFTYLLLFFLWYSSLLTLCCDSETYGPVTVFILTPPFGH
jgi:hypothetical protein